MNSNTSITRIEVLSWPNSPQTFSYRRRNAVKTNIYEHANKTKHRGSVDVNSSPGVATRADTCLADPLFLRGNYIIAHVKICQTEEIHVSGDEDKEALGVSNHMWFYSILHRVGRLEILTVWDTKGWVRGSRTKISISGVPRKLCHSSPFLSGAQNLIFVKAPTYEGTSIVVCRALPRYVILSRRLHSPLRHTSTIALHDVHG